MKRRKAFRLAMAAFALAACATTPNGAPSELLALPTKPVVDNSFTRGDKASPTPPPQSFSYILPQPEPPPKWPDRGAQPLVRIPPEFPEECLAEADQKEVVTIEFDVTSVGATVNIRILNSTNDCFDKAAIRSVERWRYVPATDSDGKPRWRRGVQTAITFELYEEPDPFPPPLVDADSGDAPICRPTAKPGYQRCPAEDDEPDWAVIEYDVSPDGFVVNPKVAESSGNQCFNQFAKNWVYSSKCDPAKEENGDARWYRRARSRVSNAVPGTE